MKRHPLLFLMITGLVHCSAGAEESADLMLPQGALMTRDASSAFSVPPRRGHLILQMVGAASVEATLAYALESKEGRWYSLWRRPDAMNLYLANELRTPDEEAQFRRIALEQFLKINTIHQSGWVIDSNLVSQYRSDGSESSGFLERFVGTPRLEPSSEGWTYAFNAASMNGAVERIELSGTFAPLRIGALQIRTLAPVGSFKAAAVSGGKGS